jgi:tRNA A37 threonylcarbamoyladenosine modification protein TsaB
MIVLLSTLAMIIGAPLVVVLTLTALAQFRQKD